MRRDWAKVFGQSDRTDYIRNIVLKTDVSEFEAFFKTGSMILDGGCSEGAYCFALENRGYATVGIDIVESAIKTAHRFGKSCGSKAMFIVADVTKLPIRNGALDGYISLGVVEHFRSIEEIRHAFSEAARVLASGAGFSCCTECLYSYS